MSAAEVITRVRVGEADDNLEGLLEAVRERIKTQGRFKFMALKVGDRVRLIGGQKYLQGAIGTITKKTKTNFVVDLDEERGNFHRNVVCPPELIELVTPVGA